MANPDFALLPDMYVDANIDTADGAPVLAVPESSVLDTGTRQAVLVDKGEGRFEPRAVKVGRRGGGFIEIRDGLAAGERGGHLGQLSHRRGKQSEGRAQRFLDAAALDGA